MTEETNENKRTARLVGILFLLATITGGFGLSYVRSNLIVPGDAAATAANITASEFLFRVAIVSTLLSQVFMFFVGITLFRLFSKTDDVLRTVLLASVLITVAIAIVNTLNNFGVLLLLNPADYLKVFTTEQRQAIAMTLLRLSNSGQGLLEIFWTPYYLSFGLLVLKSRLLPKVLGILLIIMSTGYAINILDKFLVPQFHPVAFTRLAMSLGALGGIPTMLWLLVKGAQNKSQPDQLAATQSI